MSVTKFVSIHESTKMIIEIISIMQVYYLITAPILQRPARVCPQYLSLHCTCCRITCVNFVSIKIVEFNPSNGFVDLAM